MFVIIENNTDNITVTPKKQVVAYKIGCHPATVRRRLEGQTSFVYNGYTVYKAEFINNLTARQKRELQSNLRNNVQHDLES